MISKFGMYSMSCPGRARPAFRFWLLGCLLWLALGAGHVMAQSHDRMLATDWAQAGPKLPLTPSMRYFKETPGRPLDWQQALDADAWQSADPKGMSALHQAATMWMQLEVQNTSATAQTRWVVVDYWTLMDVRLFMLDVSQPRLLAQLRSGQGLAPQDRALNTEKAAFPVTLQPGQRMRLLMRVSGLYWSHMVLDAWDSAAFTQSETSGRLQFSMVLGAVLALFAVLLLQRDKTLAVVAVWMVLSLMLELTYAGLVSEYLVPARVLAPAMLLLLLGSLINSASSFVTMYFMGLDKHRFWWRWNWGLFIASFALALWALDARSNAMRQVLSLMNVVQILSNLALLGWARIRGNPLRQWMVVIMASNFALAIARVVVRQFYVDPETFVLLMNSALMIKGSLVLTVIALAALRRQRDLTEVRERLRDAEQQQREQLQAAVNQRTAELHQALVAANEANHAKTDFLARVSHDLRSPLTSISGYAQLLQRVGGRTASLAQIIGRSANHMLAMVNDLIEYARGATAGRPDPAPVYINGWLQDMARDAAILVGRSNSQFVLQIETELPLVLLLDARRLRQMLVNLLDNAAKFTKNGQVELRVSAQALPSQPGQVLLQLAVHDTGPGIDPLDQAKLFEPFYRSPSAQGVPGVGLGLSIVQTWAERLGGSVSVASQPGQGAIFTLRLPAQIGREDDMTQRQWQDEAAYLPKLDGARRGIWVVEDNVDIRELLVEELRSMGFVVTSSPDGADFLARMRAFDAAPPALVLTDYQMPEADGSAVLEAVRQHWPTVPVVLLSATQKTMQAVGAARDEGFDAHLMKPVNLANLRTTLAQLLGIDMVFDEWGAELEHTDDLTPAAPSALPPAQELELVSKWLDMGAWSDLTDWAEALAQRHPDCAQFAHRMLDMLAQGRLEDIRLLCAEGCGT